MAKMSKIDEIKARMKKGGKVNPPESKVPEDATDENDEEEDEEEEDEDEEEAPRAAKKAGKKVTNKVAAEPLSLDDAVKVVKQLLPAGTQIVIPSEAE